MGWSYCGTDEDGRDIGYGISATCDHPGCETKIDRGLSYCCGDMHGGDLDEENTGTEAVLYQCCGRYFCPEHLATWWGPEQGHNACRPCIERLDKEMAEKGDIDCLEKDDRAMIAKLENDDA
jgi:hypothetical protein